MSKPRIKKGDQVLVLAGKDRGVRAKVLRVLPKQDKAIVEQVNMMKKHTRPNPQKQVKGGVLETEAPIRLSNLMLICPESGKPTRTGRRQLDDGRRVRVSKVSGATID